MGTTPVYQLPYPELADPADVPIDMKELCQRLETVLAQIGHAGAIPGEIRAWAGAVLPLLADYGHWAWADGAVYSSATYPKAAAHIANGWRTAFGAADPGAGNFRVPDLRGLVLVGLDAMPGGARANRVTRAQAQNIAARLGEEFHALTAAELAAHAHGVNDPTHAHGLYDPTHIHYIPSNTGGPSSGGYRGVQQPDGVPDQTSVDGAYTGMSVYGAGTGISVQANGGGGAHENLPPSTFVPYIVKLDD